MGMDVVVVEETATGQETARVLLAGVPRPVTVRELIRFRVREEVVRRGGLGAGVRWEVAAEEALGAFRRNGFFVFVGGRQVEELDLELELGAGERVTFVRLVPLVGG
ncbi:hypothetical protein JOF53_007515 [Crossiella equi]|uniref:MoaD/ThiS family protein n=1 Tax=Crossiella equi TaxID=130796 RepID=A0ABS5APZ4_9PSEU|nr:hypothetical protein [Crossiella equi]MBP2478643.1 hypothetical protein [Crossiella equi]